jgi:DNA-3-methyladenine glycosylase I
MPIAWPAGDVARLLADRDIIRNRLKIDATVENARRIQHLRQSRWSFSNWLGVHHPRPTEAWAQLFRRTFRFTGGQIMNEFLLSLGYLPGAHEPDCPAYARILDLSRPGAVIGSRIDAGAV